MAKIPKQAAEATILDLDGAPHRLKETWAEQTVVLAFVRHFG